MQEETQAGEQVESGVTIDRKRPAIKPQPGRVRVSTAQPIDAEDSETRRRARGERSAERRWRHVAWLMSGVLAAGLLTSVGPPASAQTTPSIRLELARVQLATARYFSVARAERDGYQPITGCIASPGVGAMGIHYANARLMNDGVVDPERPDILLYMPEGRGLRLVGVEYWVADADQDLTTSGDRPAAFGQPFNGPMAGHVPGMPVHFDLHVWVWKTNPAGVFASYNPALRCPDTVPSGTAH